MKLPLKNLPLNSDGLQQPYTITLTVWAEGELEAAAMKEALQSFLSHFTLTEMKSAAAKLKNPINRKAIKTFL